MPKTLEALLRLQSIEHQLVEVRRRLRTRSAAVEAQQTRVEQLQGEYQSLHDEHQNRQKDIAGVELDLKAREEQVAKLRLLLNTAKTNKEYATILTQINTIKADNSKVEEDALRLMQAADEVKQRAEQVKGQIEQAEQYLQQIQQTSAEEIGRLEAMREELQAKRDGAAADVPHQALSVFERISVTREGEAMARIEVIGDKPPHEYVCGGCNMAISAEHANALRTRDEIRFGDCCGRILYLANIVSRQEV
jgi:predicted  nucleic acid-binding Zn-ribbon protein